MTQSSDLIPEDFKSSLVVLKQLRANWNFPISTDKQLFMTLETMLSPNNIATKEITRAQKIYFYINNIDFKIDDILLNYMRSQSYDIVILVNKEASIDIFDSLNNLVTFHKKYGGTLGKLILKKAPDSFEDTLNQFCMVIQTISCFRGLEHMDLNLIFWDGNNSFYLGKVPVGISNKYIANFYNKETSDELRKLFREANTYDNYFFDL